MFDDFYSGKRVLVTGHMGFKGTWLCVWLESLGAEVFGFSDEVPSSPAMFGVLGLADRLDHATGDVREAEAVARRVAAVQPDVVFHLAAQPIVRRSYEEPLETLATNVMGSAHVLEAVRLAGRRCRVVMVTSDKCYENVEWTYGYRETDALGGKDPYSASKGAAEVVVHSYHCSYFSEADSGVRIASARAGNVIGGGDWAANRLVPDCVRAWGRRESVEIRRPNATRPWQHVLEPLSGYLALGAALERDPAVAGEAFNFGPAGEASHTVGALLEALASHWPDRPDWPGQDTERLVLAADPGVHEAGLLKLNCDKALHELAWRPVWDFAETVAATAFWYLGYEKAGGEGLLAFTEMQIQAYASRAAEKGIPWSQPSQS